MDIFQLQTGADNPILRKKSVPVKKIDSRIKKLIKNMEATIKREKGVGLAAPQVGENTRLILVRLNIESKSENLAIMVNPEITRRANEEVVAEEGCLSLPGIYRKVSRSREITVVFETIKRDKISLKLKDLNARIVQHEIDHLNGVLISDYNVIARSERAHGE